MVTNILSFFYSFLDKGTGNTYVERDRWKFCQMASEVVVGGNGGFWWLRIGRGRGGAHHSLEKEKKCD